MDQDCVLYARGITPVLELLSGKWTLQILCALRFGPVRLSQLTRLTPTASKKALRAALRALEASEFVIRHDLSKTVLHVEYDLSENDRPVISGLLDHLAVWGHVLEKRESARMAPLSPT
jgi:DNA-binding HxlR family transcriptional regulator